MKEGKIAIDATMAILEAGEEMRSRNDGFVHLVVSGGVSLSEHLSGERAVAALSKAPPGAHIVRIPCGGGTRGWLGDLVRSIRMPPNGFELVSHGPPFRSPPPAPGGSAHEEE